jgi:pimeloyl-ACP methyl ester carboxylesterase
MNDLSARSMSRRHLLLAAAAAGAAPLVGCATSPNLADMPPIVFMPGNGDTAAIWMTTIWRFESNGWPRERLHAVDMPYPLARDDDSKPQPGRSSTEENMAYLGAEVKKVLAATGASKVVLMGNSRGGYAIRNYIAHGGAPFVSSVVLGGTPNHGVFANPKGGLGSEFNGAGPFLSALNAPQGSDGNEVPGGIRWMTVRSDSNDKYAQPDGIWIGQRGTPTNVGFDGPALKGAENVVIAGIDHRETSFSAKAFAEAYRFITGKAPATLAIVPETRVTLDGIVSGLGLDNAQGNFATNLPLTGAVIEVYATNPLTGERVGDAKLRKSIGSDGRWGPFAADGSARYEIVVAAAGHATTHIYRSPFPRSSSLVNLHPERLAEADRSGGALVIFNRMRGYFGVPRDRVVLDGVSPPAGIPSGVPGVASAKAKIADGNGRTVIGEFNDERIVGRTWPAAENQVTVLDLTG